MASIPTPLPAPEPQASISAFGRIIGVLFSPKATFEDIARKPSWLLPVVISTLLGHRRHRDAESKNGLARLHFAADREKVPKRPIFPPEQKERQIEMGAKITIAIVYAVGVLGSTLFALIVAAVMMLAYNLLVGAGASFAQSLAISAHTLMVGLVSTPVLLLILFLRPKGTTDPENPMATNLAAFLPEDSAKWLMVLCKSLDIFTIWMLILLAIGFAAVNPRKLKGSKSYVVAFSVWGAMVLAKVFWTFIWS